MQDVRVRLTKPAMKALNEAASALNMTPEQMFEYLIRNTLPIYPNLAEEGHIRYFHDGEHTAWLKLKDEWFIDKIASKLFSKEKPVKAPGLNVFTAAASAEIEEQVKAMAKRFNLNTTDLCNGLVRIGSDLAIHLKTGTAYAFNKKNQLLGMIEFKQ